jgi:hypothetical protein
VKLAKAPGAYDAAEQNRLRAALEAADRESLKRGRDLELAGGARLILQDTVTGARYALTVASGAVTLTAL